MPDAYAIVPDAAALPVAVQVAEALRAAGVAVLMHAGARQHEVAVQARRRQRRALGADLRRPTNWRAGVVAVKPLRDATARAGHAAAGRRRGLGAELLNA